MCLFYSSDCSKVSPLDFSCCWNESNLAAFWDLLPPFWRKHVMSQPPISPSSTCLTNSCMFNLVKTSCLRTSPVVRPPRPLTLTSYTFPVQIVSRNSQKNYCYDYYLFLRCFSRTWLLIKLIFFLWNIEGYLLISFLTHSTRITHCNNLPCLFIINTLSGHEAGIKHEARRIKYPVYEAEYTLQKTAQLFIEYNNALHFKQISAQRHPKVNSCAGKQTVTSVDTHSSHQNAIP